MPKAKTSAVSAVAQLVFDRQSKMDGAVTGNEAIEKLKTMTNNDPSESTWEVGDKFSVPTNYKDLLVLREYQKQPFAGIAVETEAGIGRFLIISSLRRNATEYGEDLQPTGRRVHSEDDLYTEVMKCATQFDILELIAGMTLEVTKVERVRIADRVNNQVVGTRMQSVVTFTEV